MAMSYALRNIINKFQGNTPHINRKPHATLVAK